MLSQANGKCPTNAKSGKRPFTSL